MNFIFDELLYTNKPSVIGEFPQRERNEIAIIKKNHPELNDWGDLAIYLAWEHYSDYVCMMGWNDDITRSEDFLSFLCWEQTRGAWLWGNSPEGLDEVLPVWKSIKSQ